MDASRSARRLRLRLAFWLRLGAYRSCPSPFALPSPLRSYHGPLAAQEGLGTASPGPVYDLPSPSACSGSPAACFGTSHRDSGSKVYISRWDVLRCDVV